VDHGGTERRSADGAIRRFHPVTVVNHWINAVGFLLAMVTGSLQYLRGVLDVSPPIPLFWVYRLHYVAASLIVFAAALFVTHHLLTGDRRLLPQRGQWIRSFRGVAHELPRPLGRGLAAILGLDMRREPPAVGQFTYYEKAVSFPIWTALLALILITGFLKAMKYVLPIPGEVLWWASALHVAAMVMLAAKLLDHLRYVFAPSRWPLLRSMFTTWVSERHVQLRHPEWYRAILAERSPQTEAAGAAIRPAAAPSAPAASGTAE
jgi:cytochrome b subunit of formate dehydrogenase